MGHPSGSSLRSRARGCAALTLTLTLSLGGVARAAAAEPEAAAEATPTDPALTEAQALYAEGLTHYETLDYDLAIDRWKEALGRLRTVKPHSPEQANSVAAARNGIVYNIARAQEKAFEQDGDVARLKKAKGLLERYVEENVAAGSNDEEDLARARARIDELGALIDEHAKREAARRPAEPKAKPVDAPSQPKGRGLIGGGSALLVAGVGLLAGGVSAGAIMSNRAEARLPELDQLADEPERRDELARGRRGDAIVIACAVSGGALAIAGAVLIGVGARKAKSSRRAAAPLLGPGFAGIAWHGRF